MSIMNKIELSEKQIGRFAVVKLWPEIKTAEDECIARLKTSAELLGIECVEIHANGERMDLPGIYVSPKNVDFVIHLHYDTPKNYDAFSFVALWNPLQFYHEWGYARTSRNLTTHDDFLSCGCKSADDHVSRMIRGTSNHLPPLLKLFHSTPDIVHLPARRDYKLFYAGINWEAISGGKSRHQDVLKELDATGLLRIYGPEIFQGVRVWANYKSYVREIPFDGKSMIDEIANAGIALVLSSQAHKDAGLMSNRLFESIAAGALVICDENQFAKSNFGNSLLYIDGRLPAKRIVADIKNHIRWAFANPSQVHEMVAHAQEIFLKGFSLNGNIRSIYANLDQRKDAIAQKRSFPGNELRVEANFLMPEFSPEILRRHLNSIDSQDWNNLYAFLVVDRKISDSDRAEIASAVTMLKRNVKLREVDFFNYGINNEVVTNRRLGEVIADLLNFSYQAGAFMVVAPNEQLYSNHVSVLVGALQRDPGVDCAATAALLKRGAQPIHGVHELIDFGHVDKNGPIGYGRFIFRKKGIPEDIAIALPYLEGRPLAALVGNLHVYQQMTASIVIDLETEFPDRNWNEGFENKIIEDYSPAALILKTGFGPKPQVGVIVSNTQTGRVSWRQFLKLLLNYRWLKIQLQEMRKQGLAARIQAFKMALGL